MKENYDLDQFDYIQTSNPFQQKSKQNISPIQNIQETNQFTIVLHFSSTKAFSFVIPNTWTTKKLLSFILTTFKSEIRNLIPVIIYKGNLMQTFSETVLKDYLEPFKLNHIIITLKDKEKNNSQEENKENKDNNVDNNNKKNILDNIYSKSNKEVFKTEEFCDMEKYVMNDYTKIFKEDSLINFPLMSPAYNSRREQMKYDSQTEKLAQFEPIPLEDFPFKNYFQLKIIFKCIISFFALGIYIKGFNFILFLFVLVIYYWYCINNIIEDFYKKKFQEIGLTEEEYKRIGGEIKDLGKKLGSFSFDKDDNGEGEEEEESENDKNDKEDIIYEEKTDENKNNNINKDANNKINIDIEEDIKEINTNLSKDKTDIIKEPMKDLEFKEDNKNNDNPQMNNDIKNLEKKKKKKEEKKENEAEEIEEPERETPLQIAYQIIYVFFISFIPPWCDEFEAQNPMPVNNPPNQNNNNINNIEENQNNINNDNNNINNIENLNNINNDNNNNINNENNINNNIFNNINNEINDNNIGQAPLNSPNQEEDSNNNKMTSSKVANISEDSNRDNRMFNLIKKDNQSLNENEYVFSENGGIDSLSMNSELFKQKKEKEKEKEKENKDNKEIKEKEKEIFEVEEENIIEEDKHLKNE